MAKLCKKCGSLLENGARTCPHCGEEIYVRTGSVPVPPAEAAPPVTPVPGPVAPPPTPVPKPVAPPTAPVPRPATPPPAPVTPTPKKKKPDISEKKAKKAVKKVKKSKTPIIILIVALVLLLLLGGCTLIILDAFGIVDIPFIGSNSSTNEPRETAPDIALDTSIPEDYTVAQEDAEAYFRSNAKILSVQDAAASVTVQTEAQVTKELNSRGFGDQPITSVYSMTGEYSEPTEVSASSNTKHPSYMTYYCCANGQVWTIFDINGVIMAKPISYLTDHNSSVEVIISETPSVTSYDGASNKFYETIPNASELVVKTVTRIDAQTLENLDYGAIDAL